MLIQNLLTLTFFQNVGQECFTASLSINFRSSTFMICSLLIFSFKRYDFIYFKLKYNQKDQHQSLGSLTLNLYLVLLWRFLTVKESSSPL